MISHLLNFQPFQISAADCLQVICGSKVKPYMFLQFVQVVPQAIASMPEHPEFSDSVEVYKRVAVDMADMIESNLEADL